MLDGGAQDQALGALEVAESTFERPVFPCALIAGDVVLLHLLHRQGFLDSGKVKVVFIDTFHLFPETHELLHRLEASAVWPLSELRSARRVVLHHV